MRIERHQVGESRISGTLEDATDRITRLVISSSKADRMTTGVWSFIAEEFLDYLGALSAADPELSSPEARAVLEAAAESAAGAVQFAAYWPHVSFSVFLDYVNFGMSYDPDEGPSESVSVGQWLDAFCLAVLVDKAERHGEAFHFAREVPQQGREGEPSVELMHGLMVYVLGDLGDEDAPYPPGAEHKLAALDDALARIRAQAPAGAAEHPHTTALAALRALAAGDRAGFDACLTSLLVAQSARSGLYAGPHTLLPLEPLALAALAYRREGWWPPLSTDYLPRTLITGFEGAGPRVGAYGADRRPDAVAELAVRSLVVDRPDPTGEAASHAEYLLDDVRQRTARGRAGAGDWQSAVALALIGGRREELAPLVVGGAEALAQDGSAFAAYRKALLDYLHAEDPRPAADEALQTQERSRDWGFRMPPAVLLSQLVDGDEESFNLALADALEQHRDHYRVADRAQHVDSALDLDVLGLACHARRRGWAVRVSSPYLPSHLLDGARPLAG
ncbi:Imm49 family immunity protein [Streptomyces sp. NPDC005955]|uniref:immunity 49 family protein n=1 Tax=Streptomyces sp. NPDC005955 TaxID=3364738 RepID=UPI003690DC08